MKSNLALLMTAIVAIVSTMAVIAEPASAGKIGSKEGYPVRLKGSQVGELVQKFENDTLELKCPVALFTGEIAGETEEVKGVTAEYKGEGEKSCKAFGLNATYTMNTCTYTWKNGAEKEKEMIFEGTYDIVCGATPIKVVTATCEVQIGAQTGLGPGTWSVMTNTPTGVDDLTWTPSVLKKIAYKETKDGIGCPLTHLNEARTDGSFTGPVTIQVFDLFGGFLHEVFDR